MAQRQGSGQMARDALMAWTVNVPAVNDRMAQRKGSNVQAVVSAAANRAGKVGGKIKAG